MESHPIIPPVMSLPILLLALTFFIIWIVRRRKKRNEEINASGLVKKPYTTSQIFGIIGILVFMLPISWIVVVMLQKGLYLLFILFFGWIKLQIISTILKSIFFVSTFFLMFAGIYLVCEFIWPKRFINKEQIETLNEKSQMKSSWIITIDDESQNNEINFQWIWITIKSSIPKHQY